MLNVIKEISQLGRIYEVGGCVRDHLMGRAPKDTDYLVTGIPMEDLIGLLRKHGTVNLVGKSFGVIKFRHGGVEYDIALPRKEESTGKGHKDFAVNYSEKISLEDDLFRRDFTVNSIARCAKSGAFIDPFGGAQDIHDKMIRIVNPQAFVDDPLRMLRAVQFAARFGFSLSRETFASMKENAELVKSISPERIATELGKLLISDKPSIGFDLMRDSGILSYVLPELAANIGVAQPIKYHAHDVYGHLMAACDNAVKKTLEMRIVMLLHDIGKYKTISFKEDGTPQFLGHAEVGAVMARSILERLKFSTLGVNIDRVCDLIEDHMFECDCDSSPKSLRKFISKIRRNKYGMDYVFDLIRVRCADRLGKGIAVDLSEWVVFAKRIRNLRHGAPAAFGLKDLALNGDDLIAAGMKRGKAIGVVLAGMLERVLENPSLNTRGGLFGLLEKTDAGIVLRGINSTDGNNERSGQA